MVNPGRKRSENVTHSPPCCVIYCCKTRNHKLMVLMYCLFHSLSGQSAVPELHRPSVLLSAPSHLLLSGEGLPHDAAGETPTMFHPKVVHLPSKQKNEVSALGCCNKNVNREKLFTWPPGLFTPLWPEPEPGRGPAQFLRLR